MGHCLGWGNSYAEIIRDKKTGTPLELQLLSPDPNETRPKRIKRGPFAGRLAYEVEGGKRRLLAENVLHIAGFGFDGLCGYSPVQYHRQGIALGLAAERFGGSFFGNGSRAGGLLKVPKTLSAEAIANLRDSFERVHQGADNAHRIAVLEEGVDWVQNSVNPEDAQFLATRQFQVVEVARIYGVPPHKIGDYSRATFSNIEESNLDYVISSILPWVIEIEQEYNLKLFTRRDRMRGYFVEHSFNTLLRGNMAARASYYKQMFELGVFSSNDIARLENVNPIGPEGDTRFVPLNMSTLKDAAKGDDSAGGDDPAPDQEPTIDPLAGSAA
jgi:HK97 family phage portal protein